MSKGPKFCWRRGSLRWLAAVCGAAALALGAASAARAQYTDPLQNIQNIGVRPDLLKQVSIEQKLNQEIPLDIGFVDEHGRPVMLRQYFQGKPVILSLVYFNCPMLCTQLLNGVERSLKLITMNMGKDYDVVTVSIDPTDTPVLAEAKQAMYTSMYDRPGAAQGWHFLTGAEPQIERLADAVGFHYAYDPQSKQYAHASAIVVLTPEGRISKYLYGINFSERDLRLALVQASEGKIGTVGDQILLFCYHYDPHTGKYGLLISHVIELAGLLTVVIGGICLIVLFRGEHYQLPGRKA